MSNYLHQQIFMLFAKEGETARDLTGVTHVAALVGDQWVAFCSTPMENGEWTHEDDVDCMTCIILRERFATEVLR